MDATTLIVGMIFGTIGIGYFIFGKNQSRMVPLGAGLALMAIPMFVTNVIVCSVICVATMAAPFVIRDA